MSRGSRGASDVLAQIRSVISHLERKDHILNNKLKTWESLKNGDESERIKGLVAENASLKENVRQNSDLSSEKMQEIRHLKDENAHLQGSISAKDAEINKLLKDVSFEQSNVNLLEQNYQELTEKLKKSQADLLGTREQMNSYATAHENLTKKHHYLQNENVELKEDIKRLERTAASTDQNQLQIAYGDLSKEFNKVEAELKQIKPISDKNYQIANQWKNESEKGTKQIEILQAEIAKLRSGGAAAGSPDLVSLDPPPPPIAARLEVERAKDDTKDPIAIAKADNSQTNTASQQPAQKQTSYLGAAAGAVGTVLNAIGLGGGGRGTNSVDDSSDEGDDIVAGSPSREPERGAGSVGLHPLYTVTEEVKNDKIGDNTVPAAPVAAASSNNTFGGQPAAASGGGGHAVVDVDEIIKKATEEVQKNKVIDMLKMSLNDMKVDPRLFQYVQKTNNGSLMTKTDPKTKRKVPDMHYKVLFPGMAVSGIPTQQNVDAYCKCLSNEQLNALENLYDIHGSTRAESIDKLVKLKTYISSWSTLLAENRDKLMALCDNKGIPYPEKSISEIAEWFKKHARTDSLRKEIYDILDS
jgi:hypothetical protein